MISKGGAQQLRITPWACAKCTFVNPPGAGLCNMCADARERQQQEAADQALARSMPTSGAVDRVAAKLEVPLFETPTGWKVC